MKQLFVLLACCLVGTALQAKTLTYNFQPAQSSQVCFTGRAAQNADGSLGFDWSGSHFTFAFNGTACAMRASDTKRNYYNVFIDGKPYGKVTVEGKSHVIPLAQGLKRGTHTVLVQKRTEAEQGRTTLEAVGVAGKWLAAPAVPERWIEFIGDSHTCGYGSEGKSPKEPFTPETENCDLAWGCILARYFDARYTLIAHSGQGVVRNYGDKREYSPYTMRERLLRTFDQDSTVLWKSTNRRPDIVIIKLGTNDTSCDLTPSEAAFDRAFTLMLHNIRSLYGDVPVLYVAPQGVQLFFDYICRLAPKLNDPTFHYMLDFNEVCNWTTDLGANFHPNHHGQRKMAMAVAPYIATIMGWELPAKVID